jgi:hypothetical protein
MPMRGVGEFVHAAAGRRCARRARYNQKQKLWRGAEGVFRIGLNRGSSAHEWLPARDVYAIICEHMSGLTDAQPGLQGEPHP